MSYNYSIEKLLEIQEISEFFTEEKSDFKEIRIKLNRKTHKCPCCECETNKIHDYRTQRIKDLPIFGKKCVLVLKKRRYVCMLSLR